MKSVSLCAVLTIFLVAFGSAMASELNEHRIASAGRKQLGRYISLACAGGSIKFTIQWTTKIGDAGKYRRHLVLPGALSDTHILLKVLPDQTSTGVIDSDQQAKSLIKLILQNTTGYFYLEVFPEGRDSVTGTWESSEYYYGDFQEITNAVAKECHWDIQDPIDTTVRTVKPGAPYDDG